MGQNAIDLGVWFRPDVLLVDWLLKGPIDGIRVSKAVRAAHSETHTIPITGFASYDLRQVALKVKTFGFFEKPLDFEKVHRAIDKAVETPALRADPEVGLLEYDTRGQIVDANSKARKMLGLPVPLTDESRLSNTFSYRSICALRGANRD